MSTLLPPSVIGPVSELSTDVRIDGPLPGASVELLINGVSAVTVNAGRTTTVASVAIGRLKAGDLLTARWSLNGETSDPTPVATVVMGVPTTLAPLSYLSLVHECVDWILLGGCFPGASVELFNGATPIGSAIASGTTVAVNVLGTINANDVLQAMQFVQTPTGTHRSPSTPSLPVEQTPFRENTMPALSVGAVPDCAESVPIYGIAQGASIHLNDNGDIVKYAFNGTSFGANIGREAHRPDLFSATQHFERCNASSLPSAPAVTDDTLPIRTPIIQTNQIHCPAARAITLSNLEPGAVLTLQLIQPSGETTVIGRIGVGEGVRTTQIWIPDLTTQLPPNPPFPSLVVIQERCGKSATSDKAFLQSTYQGSIFPPTILEPLVECAGGVLLNSVDAAVVQLFSDAPDTPVISDPVFNSYTGIVWVPTYRPLRAGEHITAKLMLTCQPPDRMVGPAVEVEGLPDLTPPKLREPIRVFFRSVFIDHVVPGANVHVFVNGKWRAQELVAQYGGFVNVDVGALKVEDQITAVQALCTEFWLLDK